MSKNKKKKGLGLFPKFLIFLLLLGAAGYFLYAIKGYRVYKIPEKGYVSMEPTLSPGDFILVETKGAGLDYNNGDIVLINRNHPDSSLPLIKRIIAKTDDIVEYKNSTTFVNSRILKENYVCYASNVEAAVFNAAHKEYEFGPATVPPDKYFVMGDNRNLSIDSRDPQFGFVSKDEIIGKPLLILWSDNNSKIFKVPK